MRFLSETSGFGVRIPEENSLRAEPPLFDYDDFGFDFGLTQCLRLCQKDLISAS
jgi:hypothetical protein